MDPRVADEQEREHTRYLAFMHDVLVALVDKDARRARESLAALESELWPHIEREEQQLLPQLMDLLPEDGPLAARNVEADHRLIERVVDEVRGLLAQLPDAPTADLVVGVLPVVYRLRGALEHHAQRERNVWPRLDEVVSAG